MSHVLLKLNYKLDIRNNAIKTIVKISKYDYKKYFI